MCAGGERTKGLDTGKGLVRTFIYMNNTTTPNMRFHHLTSTFATTAGRLVAPMRSLVTKFLAVTAIFLLASTVFAPSAFASSSSDDGVLLVTGNWGLNDLELPMLHDGEKFDENFQVQLATDPGAETTVHLTLSNQFKDDDVDKPKIELDKTQLIFTSENWNLPQNVLVDHLEAGWKDDPAFITLTVNGSETTITLIHVHDDDDDDDGVLDVDDLYPLFAPPTLTFTYAGNTDKPIVGITLTQTQSDSTVTTLTSDANGKLTLPATTANNYTLSASFTETGEDPVDLLDAIWILQHGGELRDLTAEQLQAADVNADGLLDIFWGTAALNHHAKQARSGRLDEEHAQGGVPVHPVDLQILRRGGQGGEHALRQGRPRLPTLETAGDVSLHGQAPRPELRGRA